MDLYLVTDSGLQLLALDTEITIKKRRYAWNDRVYQMSYQWFGRAFAVATLAVATLVTSDAPAATQTFTDRALFDAELTNQTTLDFEGNYLSSWNNYNTGAGFDFGGVNFVAPLLGGYYLYIIEGDVNPYASILGGMHDGDSVLVEGRGTLQVTFATAVNAVGLDFAITEGTGTFNVTMGLGNGETANLDAVASTPNFFGLVSDTSFTTMTFETTLEQRPPQLLFDNFTFGSGAITTPVPVPAALPFLLAGLGGLRFAARRRKAS